MIWKTFLLVCGVKCIVQENNIQSPGGNEVQNHPANDTDQDKVQEKIILSPRFNEVLINNSLEITCHNPYGAAEITWGTLKETSKFSQLYYLKEGSCTSDGFLGDSKLYETKCYSNATFKVKIKRVNLTYHGQEWYCSHRFIKSNIAVIEVLVPFKTIKIENVPGGVLKVVEKLKTSLTCETSQARPSAKIAWIKISKTGLRTDITNDKGHNVSTIETLSEGNMAIVRSSIDLKAVREDNGTRILCEATHKKSYVIRKEITLYVQYPPDKPMFLVGGENVNDTVRIICGNNMSILCQSESYPQPTYHWKSTRHSEYIGKYLNIFNSTRNDTWQCTTTNSMTLPNKTTLITGKQYATLKIHVMFPTTKPVLFLEKGNIVLNKTLYALRNDNITILCHSDGNPVPEYNWLGLRSGAKLHLTLIKENTSKTCIASNSMVETVENVQNSSSNTTVSIVVSYPPGKPYLNFTGLHELVKNGGRFLTNKIIVEENSSFIVTCHADGYPSPKCNWNVELNLNSSRLSFTNISKNATGLYKCTAENMIKRSFPAYEVKMNTSTDLEINVLYKSRITFFKITGHDNKHKFVVTENEIIIFNCNVDSNPDSSIAISYKGNQLVHDVSTKSLLYTRRVISCFDAGVYQCVAKNWLNNEPVLKEIYLLVKCKPRRSPDFNIISDISAARNRTATFVFEAIANPTPLFKWYKWSGSIWKTVERANKYEIHTDGPTSNLSIRNISEDDYGRYKLAIHNEFGYIEQLYSLKANVSPRLHFQLSENGFEGNKFIVNTSADISFLCFSDSGVLFDMDITNKKSQHIALTRNTTYITHTITNVSCEDAGEYICSAANMTTLQLESVSKLILTVTCPPMPFPKTENNLVLAAVYSNVKLQFGVNEYFDDANKTTYIWYKQNSPIQNDSSKYMISSEGFQSTLFIRIITITDFGQYRILVRNSFGEYIQVFKLQEKEQDMVGEFTTALLLLVPIGTLCFAILVIVLVVTGYRIIRRERGDTPREQADTPSAAVANANQAASSDDNDDEEHYEEVIHIYEQVNEQFMERATYVEMRNIHSEDYYLTPTI